MFFRPLSDGRCLIIGVVDNCDLKSDSIVGAVVITNEYREAPEMIGKSASTIMSEGWKGLDSNA